MGPSPGCSTWCVVVWLADTYNLRAPQWRSNGVAWVVLHWTAQGREASSALLTGFMRQARHQLINCGPRLMHPALGNTGWSGCQGDQESRRNHLSHWEFLALPGSMIGGGLGREVIGAWPCYQRLGDACHSSVWLLLALGRRIHHPRHPLPPGSGLSVSGSIRVGCGGRRSVIGHQRPERQGDQILSPAHLPGSGISPFCSFPFSPHRVNSLGSYRRRTLLNGDRERAGRRGADGASYMWLQEFRSLLSPIPHSRRDHRNGRRCHGCRR